MLDEGDVQAGLHDLAARYRLDGVAQTRLLALLTALCDDERSPTSVRDPIGVLHHHLADSLVALELDCVRGALKIADLGSGAGLPGLVLAIVLTEAEVHLVESRTGKCAYIAALAAKLELSNTHVVHARAEEWRDGLGQHDLVVTRALAAQPVVLEYAAPLLELSGVLVEWRGRRQPQEEQAAVRAADELGLRSLQALAVDPFEGSTDRHLHTFEKVAVTPGRFPRRAGMARKRPLGA